VLHLVNAMKRLDTDLLEELDRELSDVFPATKDLLYYFLDAPAAAASVAAGLHTGHIRCSAKTSPTHRTVYCQAALATWQLKPAAPAIPAAAAKQQNDNYDNEKRGGIHDEILLGTHPCSRFGYPFSIKLTLPITIRSQ
jgi:hypothetical protein